VWLWPEDTQLVQLGLVRSLVIGKFGLLAIESNERVKLRLCRAGMSALSSDRYVARRILQLRWFLFHFCNLKRW
jgi:hypothetical protein